MIAAIALSIVAALFLASLGDNQPRSRRTRSAYRPRLSDSPAQRRERAELAYIDEFTDARFVDTLAEVQRLMPLVEQAQRDTDPAERFFRLDLELGDAIMAYELAVERRANFMAIAV